MLESLLALHFTRAEADGDGLISTFDRADKRNAKPGKCGTAGRKS